MKKILFLTVLFILGISLIGCGKNSEKDIVEDLDKKISKADSYKLTGVLEIINNEESYLYDVEVAYKEKDQFRVSLTNQTNNHQQIILRDSDGVFVLTPSLNKSFKFESQWPYNNSQIYILQSLIEDLTGDKNYSFEEKTDNYIFKTTVKQKIYLDKKLNLKKVEVLNRDNQAQMTMKFDKIDLKTDFEDDYFNLDANMKVSQTDEMTTVSKIDDSVYPMYLPENTYLEKEDKVTKEDGERVIMTFSGDNPFMIIQETISVTDDYTTIPVSGEPTLLPDAIGAMADGELSWINNGVEYYIVSSKLKDDELVDVAKSIGVASVIKQK